MVWLLLPVWLLAAFVLYWVLGRATQFFEHVLPDRVKPDGRVLVALFAVALSAQTILVGELRFRELETRRLEAESTIPFLISCRNIDSRQHLVIHKPPQSTGSMNLLFRDVFVQYVAGKDERVANSDELAAPEFPFNFGPEESRELEPELFRASDPLRKQNLDRQWLRVSAVQVAINYTATGGVPRRAPWDTVRC